MWRLTTMWKFPIIFVSFLLFSIVSSVGKEWSLPESYVWQTVTCNSNGKYIAIAPQGGVVWLTADYGKSWAPSESPHEYWISLTSSQEGQYMVGACSKPDSNTGGSIYYSSDNGRTWIISDAPVTVWSSVATDSSGSLFVATSSVTSFGAFTSRDRGKTWSKIMNIPHIGYAWYAIAISASDTVQYLTGYHSDSKQYILLYSSNNGRTWQQHPKLQGKSIACSNSGETVVMSGWQGVVFMTTHTLLATLPVTTKPLRSTLSNYSADTIVCDSTCEHIGMINTEGKLILSSDSGKSWQFVRLQQEQHTLPWKAIAVDVTGNRWIAVGTHGVFGITFAQSKSSPESIHIQDLMTSSSKVSFTNADTIQRRRTSRMHSTADANSPTSFPTSSPSIAPSRQPSATPSTSPTSQPTNTPTSQSSEQPSNSPTEIPHCPSGTYYNYTISSYDCILCPLNTYQPSTNTAPSCIACPSGTITMFTGSTNEAKDCVNPTATFVAGWICLLFSVLVLWFYLYEDRIHAIAFSRKFRLIRKLMIIAYTTARAADFVTMVNTVYLSMQNQEMNDEQGNHDPRHPLSMHTMTISQWIVTIGKQIVFVFSSIALIITVMLLSITLGIAQVLFSAMILYKKYKHLVTLPTDYHHMADNLIDTVGESLQLQFMIEKLCYPFVMLLTGLEAITIDLTAIQVTCAGAQSPIYLLIDLVLVGMVLILIRCDVQIYWDAAQSQVIAKLWNLLFQEYYVIGHRMKTFAFTCLAIILYALPSPRKCIQYILSLVSMSWYFVDTGHTPFDYNCDHAMQSPQDTIIAVFTTMLVYGALSAVVFIGAQVIVPCFTLSSDPLDTSLPTMTREKRSASVIELFQPTIPLEEYDEEEEDNEEVKEATEDKEKSEEHTPYDEETTSATKTTTTAAPSMATMVFFQTSKGFSILSDVFLRCVCSFVSLDWLYLKTIAMVLSTLFEEYQRFCLLDHHTRSHSLSTMTTRTTRTGQSTQKNQGNEEHYQASFDEITRQIQDIRMPHIAWLSGWNDYAHFSTSLMMSGSRSEGDQYTRYVAEQIAEKQLWTIERAYYPSFVAVAGRVRQALYDSILQEMAGTTSKSDTTRLCQHTLCALLYALLTPASYLFPFQLCTSYGRDVWYRVSVNYTSIFLVAFGCWTDRIVTEYHLIENVSALKRINTLLAMNVTNMNTLLSHSAFSPSSPNFIDVTSTEEASTETISGSAELDMTTIHLNPLHATTGTASTATAATVSAFTASSVMSSERWKVNMKLNPLPDTTTTAYTSASTATNTSSTSTNSSNSSSRKEKDKNTLLYDTLRGKDALLSISNDPRSIYLRYIAAFVSVRVVLLQLIPIVSLFSIIMIEMSACPILVFSRPLKEHISEWMVWSPWTRARQAWQEEYAFLYHTTATTTNTLLHHTTSGPKSYRSPLTQTHTQIRIPTWKIACLGYYILFTQSRFLHFLSVLIRTIVTIVFIFTGGRKSSRETAGGESGGESGGGGPLDRFILIIVYWFIIQLMVQAIASACYTILAYHRYMFPVPPPSPFATWKVSYSGIFGVEDEVEDEVGEVEEVEQVEEEKRWKNRRKSLSMSMDDHEDGEEMVWDDSSSSSSSSRSEKHKKKRQQKSFSLQQATINRDASGSGPSGPDAGVAGDVEDYFL